MNAKSVSYYYGDSMPFIAKSLEYKFPKQIQKLQMYSLLKLAQDGNIDAQNIIVESNYKWIYKIAKNLWRPGSDIDDLFQVGIIGCIKAIRTFNFETDIAFLTYASVVIGNNIRMYLRKIDSQSKHIIMSLDEPIGNDKDGNEVYLFDTIMDDDIQNSPEEYTDILFTRDIILEHVSRLNDRDRELLELRFGLNGHKKLKERELANHFGFSQSYISRLLRAALNLLKDDLYYMLN